jgi:hypothetical protein
MGAGKNKSHRKKRISKHVLQAEERRKIADVEKKLVDGAAATEKKRKKEKNGSGVIVADDPNDSTSPKTMASNASTELLASSSSSSSLSPAVVMAAKKTKDPNEASSYLSLWKYDRSTTTKEKDQNKQWKFNKNTQSWLLRHMYNPTKVPKHTFALLLEYLQNGENNVGVQNRVLEEAKFRARRYKEFEKQIQQQQHSEILQEKEGIENVGVQGKEKNAQDDDTINKREGERTEISSVSKQVVGVDSTLWKEMDEHEKRKEYKRARKVLDAFKEATVVVPDGDV